jgi:hypothetical protein
VPSISSDFRAKLAFFSEKIAIAITMRPTLAMRDFSDVRRHRKYGMKAALPTFLSVNMKMPGNAPGGLEPSLLPRESFTIAAKFACRINQSW